MPTLNPKCVGDLGGSGPQLPLRDAHGRGSPRVLWDRPGIDQFTGTFVNFAQYTDTAKSNERVPMPCYRRRA